MNLYDDLGLKPDATADEVKKAHRRLVKEHHPDKPGGSKDKFRTVQHAFDILGDEEKRARYDATGDEGNIDPEIMKDREARAFVAHLVEMAVDNLDDIDFQDFIAACREQIEAKIEAVKEMDVQAAHSQGKIDRMLGRLKVEEGAEDVIGDTLRHKRRKADEHRKKLDGTLDVAQRAIGLLEVYTYQVDERPPAPLKAEYGIDWDELIRRSASNPFRFVPPGA